LPRSPDEGQCYQLNPALVEWAYRLTKDVQLPDTDAMRKRRDEGWGHAGHAISRGSEHEAKLIGESRW
ncbi:MAG: hypothetical protein ABSH09_33935, partial [Bryobacteraceae bacterium]